MSNLISKEDREEKKIYSATVYEYPFQNCPEVNTAFAEIRGRYPEQGRAINREVAEQFYIIKGQGKIVVGQEVSDVKEGDVVLVRKGIPYFLEGAFDCVIACGPAWYPEQYEIQI